MWSASSPSKISGNFARKDGVDGGAVASDREGVADALRAVRIAQPHGVEFEGAHLAVHAVGQHLGRGMR